MKRVHRAGVPDRLIAAGLVLGVAGVPLAILPAGYNPFGPVKVALLGVSAVLVALGCATGEGASRIARLARSPIAWTWLSLGALVVLSTLFAQDRRSALLGAYPGYEAGLLPLAAATIVGLGAVALTKETSERALGRSLGVAICIVGAYAILQRLGIDPMPAPEYLDAERARSTLGNASNLGLWAAVAALWLFGSRGAEKDGLWRGVYLAGGVLALTAVATSGSRGALAALGVGALVLLWLSSAPGRTRTRIGIGAAAVVLITVAAVGAMSLERSGGADTVVGRLAVWKVSAGLALDRPFLGWGLGGFGRAFNEVAPSALADPSGRDRALADPHNLLASTAVSSGLAALAALLALVWVAMRFGVRARASSAQLAILAAVLAGLQFHFLTLDIAPLAAGALALVAAAEASERKVAASSGNEPRSQTGPHLVAASAAVAALVVAASGVGLSVADVRARDAFDLAHSGAAWTAVSRPLASARAWAFFDPFPFRATARAFTMLEAAETDERCIVEAIEGIDRADVLRPGDSRVARERGDVYAVAGARTEGSGRTRYFMAARDAYALSLDRAPTEPLAWLGRGGSKLALGDVDGAIEDLGRSVELAPRLKTGWTNLAVAYELAGDATSSEAARQKASGLR